MTAFFALGAYAILVWAICRFVGLLEKWAREVDTLRWQYDRDFDDYYDEVHDSEMGNPMRDQDGNPPSFEAWWEEKQRPKLTAGKMPEAGPFR